MLFSPKQLGHAAIDPEVLKTDRKKCRRFGPCGIGKEALYLNSFFFDRYYYVPIRSVNRIFKRVAMSRGGFTGKGLFASIAYLVVEYDGGQEKQCIFKREEQVDQLISCFHELYPQIPVHSPQARKRLEERQREREKKQAMLKDSMTMEPVRELQAAADYLEQRPELYERLSTAARKRRVQDRISPSYRYAALAIVLMGGAAFGYGIYALLHHQGYAVYFLLFGLAAVFFFSGANVLPTRRSNAAYIQKMFEEAQRDMSSYTEKYPDFPVPSWYAHPIVLRRMQEILAEGRAKTIDEALAVLKEDLRAMNASVTVDQDTYEEVMAIKPLFLIRNYE